MEQLQSYLFESTASFEFVEANQPFKDENTLIVLAGLGEWGLSVNPAEVISEAAAEIPVNVLSGETMAEGLLLARQGVD